LQPGIQRRQGGQSSWDRNAIGPFLNDPLTKECFKLYAVTAAKSGGVQAAFDCVLKGKTDEQQST
jgi:hypothetical protein